jgi:hypothetical protein
VAQNNRPGLAKMNHPALFADQPDSQPSADSLKSTLGTSYPAINSTAMAALGSSTTRKNPTDLLEEFVGSLTKSPESNRERQIFASHLPASGWVTIIAGTSCCFTRLL